MTRLASRLRALPAALALMLGLAAPAVVHAENHALILWIGDYSLPEARLPGIELDAAMGRKIAAGMGVPPANIIEVSNRGLNRDGISAALAALGQRMADGDKVFIYYSGHGTQAVSPDGQSKCMEGMVSWELGIYDDRRLEADLRRLAERASQVVMLNDSCFSGGAATVESKARSLADDAPRAKFLPVSSKFNDTTAAPGSPQTCGQAVNKLSRSLEVIRAERQLPMLYLAAAAENEVSWATRRGSLATVAWTACLSSPAADADHSGTINGEELRACAQAAIDALPQGPRQTITLRGNGALPLSFAQGAAGSAPSAGNGSAPAASVAPGAPAAPAPAGGSTPAASASGSPTAAPAPTSTGSAGNAAAPVDPLRALEDVRAGADPNVVVRLTAPSATLRIGRDLLDYSVSINRPGYLYLVQVGSDGKTFNLLFPNKLDRDNFLPAGEHRFPREGWRLRSGGPEGTSHLLAILSPTSKDIGANMDRTEVFATAPANVGQTRSLVIEATGSRPGGSGRYGASEVLAVKEVQ